MSLIFRSKKVRAFSNKGHSVKKNPNCFGFFSCARRSYVFSVEKTSESGSGKFLNDGEKIIPDHSEIWQFFLK
ncbi:TPA: hypothetical protein DEQ22_02685 [Candidatus Nomurabacteria bacterium]|uniref:Uncharacterized protein n=2 Tax=Candidatus Nomuraibacteriota TaxID=1752729 RepID=A0A1F6YLE8_9BACT|nr:MAG: hypothetical protein UV23_C0029G0004 [Candidatus Nomurabacteria bacterium GW2011_GWF1_42_40]KKT00137.1 MAG: hypothetical protein UV77_C0006G0004 [Candidatus Nomurabacteria bacterium GW2011_GWA1_43_17]KKT06143.1 MAG: hypothetical protein UV85_C0024G0004 [Candidatus Nomurabacteria bacterium GW2011_GWB1_43_19]KKT10999.1 MAG: hypothetical protein UV91_C0009G0006 [Candidatus Nomurabacteria bacterium GW2011_GWF2_43_24]KKT17291.1 MAG: hypothetical protein UW01_C0021G0005 [Candidatus Nomurabact